MNDPKDRSETALQFELTFEGTDDRLHEQTRPGAEAEADADTRPPALAGTSRQGRKSLSEGGLAPVASRPELPLVAEPADDVSMQTPRDPSGALVSVPGVASLTTATKGDSVRLEIACRKVFARHETFHPRFGWVKKAYDAADSNPDLFNADEAVVELGVGKNMVRSIRHWGLAFKVIAPYKEPGKRVAKAAPSTIGRMLFADDGWDPFCEYPGTLWLLHWWLVAPKSIAPVWWLALNEFPGVEFTDDQLEQFVGDRTRDWADPHPSAIKKDVSCFLRMYAAGHNTRATFDDLIDCPFRELDLLRPSTGTAGGFRFLIGQKPTLPPAIAAFACLDFVARTDSTAHTVTISRLVTDPGSPGRTFKLTETALVNLLEAAASEHGEFELTTTNGAPQLVFGDDPGLSATEVLRDHYRRLAGEARFHGALRVAGPTADEPVGIPTGLEATTGGGSR